MAPRRSKLDDLYALRGRIEAQIEQEVARLERKAAEERDKLSSFRRGGRAECGTDGGYYRHVRTLKERACSACKRAHSQAETDRLLRRKASA